MLKQFLLLLTLTLGVALPATPAIASRDNGANKNHPNYWETTATTCSKTEVKGDKTYTFTPAQQDVTKVIVKGGPDRTVYTSGDFTDLTAPLNAKNGKHYAISHVIVCVNDELDNSDDQNDNQDNDSNDDTDTSQNDKPNKSHKVSICHRTASVKNPYVRITVDTHAVDGEAGNSHNKADHFDEHMGPVFPATGADGKWGDIIPPVGNHTGANWTEEGQAVYENGCNVVEDNNVGGNGGGVVEGDNDVSENGQTLSSSTSLPGVLPNTGSSIALSMLVPVLLALPAYPLLKRLG